MNSNAKWIWAFRDNYNKYNDVIIALKRFHESSKTISSIKITADSYYRLYINGHWVHDGPSRAWTHNYIYDTHDISKFLIEGENCVKIVARYFGCGHFHGIPQQAGLLVQIELKSPTGDKKVIVSDNSWLVADNCCYIPNTPKVSIQMEPAELYDAKCESELSFSKAVELFDAYAGPWHNLHDRCVAKLTKKSKEIAGFIGANLVSKPGLCFCIPHTRLMNQGLIEANGRVFSPFGIATELNLKSDCIVSFKFNDFERGYFDIAINGIRNPQNSYELSKGSHLVLGFARNILNNDKHCSLSIECDEDFELSNPVSSDHENPWCYIPFKEYSFVQDDMVWRWFAENLSCGRDKEYVKATSQLLDQIKKIQQFYSQLGNRIEQLCFDEMFVIDSYWHFYKRKVVSEITDSIKFPMALANDDQNCVLVEPSTKGRVELIYDLGEQNCGYYSFEIITEQAGINVDIFSVEYINGKQIQFTDNNRNGFRFITKLGQNKYTSIKRRSGRYVFITFDNFDTPIKIRRFVLVESTYPATNEAFFYSNDTELNNVSDICTRTLKLCMEDVYTDCPLYEQTLWVGDLRNEALYGYYVFGATDIAKNSLRLAAESLSKYDIVGCQVPSCWDCLLPAWSFLWVIAAWEYFWFTGDKDFLGELYPYVLKNINNAQKYITDNGLFSAPFWNMFDWAKIDQQRKTVLHNSILLVGALDAAVKCADSLGNFQEKRMHSVTRDNICESINSLWDSNKKAYPDSITGSDVSDSTCQHTSFLALLYGILPKHLVEPAISNILDPPCNMVKVGSPFATMFMYEAMEKHGLTTQIIDSIKKNYTPMVSSGATTVWETFPSGTIGIDKDSFPTRSHCHGWSTAPLYFFMRVILGVRQTAPGCSEFEISPNPCGLTEASGCIKTIYGDLKIKWQIKDKRFQFSYDCSSEVKTRFRTNESLVGYDCEEVKIC